jgi:hypothetical protein
MTERQRKLHFNWQTLNISCSESEPFMPGLVPDSSLEPGDLLANPLCPITCSGMNKYGGLTVLEDRFKVVE